MFNVLKVKYEELWPDLSTEPVNNSKFSSYCRKLIKQGVDPNTRLECWKENTLMLFTKNIGRCAEYKVLDNEKNGPKFIKYVSIPTAFL